MTTIKRNYIMKTKDNTTENNKLIAEFMGLRSTNKCIRTETGKYYDYHAHPKFSCIKEQEIQVESENGYGLVEQDFLFIEDLKFHSDWNWLMEVVTKIEGLKGLPRVHIHKNCCQIDTRFNKYDKTEHETNRIIAVYNACLSFIKWYNEQKTAFLSGTL